MSEKVRVYGDRSSQRKESTRVMVISAILLAVGAITHTVFSGPDFLLACMFVAIAISNNKKEVFAITVAAGLLTGFTQVNPVGTVASLFDKLISGFFFLFIINMFGEKYKNNLIYFAAAVVLSTILSGYIYFASYYFIGKLVGLPPTMKIMQRGILIPVLTLVMPTACANGFIATIINRAYKLTRF
ncbi:hypothetical protein KQI68_10050 [Peptoniphilus sp. MSJ-1]|uniref:Tryptophan transporter n=1 Tax=Peptoniphilus ovalis TaxID=2841503 RepID=A0ABS6FKZ7_9FIRM|nr:tryptophan transporter [Peptoniphilus ovalis]MBU5670172.1 hypothetical protein [Peptoniphilus ovalis]